MATSASLMFRACLITLVTALEVVADQLSAVCEVAEGKDVDVSEPLALLIRVRGIDATTLDTGALTTLVEDWLLQGKTWVVDNGPGIIVRAVAFVMVLVLFWLIAGLVGRITSKAVSSSRLKMSDLLRQFFVGLAHKIVFFVGLLFACRTIGVDLARTIHEGAR